MTFLQGKKTIIVNGIVAVFGVLAAVWPEAELPSSGDVSGAIDSINAAWLAVIGIVNIVLRAVTTTPVWKPGK